jgi:D-alanyl-D-alanine carboxypeptidase
MVIFRIVVFTLVLIASIPPSALGQNPNAVPESYREVVQKIEDMAALELAKEPVGSVTVGVVSDAGLVWTRSFGYADMEKKILATRDSVYRIGSITKQFTGFMLLQLAERGKVRLSDPVERYLPEIERVRDRLPGAPPITLVQLATMTSGLAREPEDLPTYLKGPVSKWQDVLLSALPKVRFQHEPDTHYLYSNIGYAILGASLSRAAGKPYVDYVTENFLDPLGMTHTAFEPNQEIEPRITKGYSVREDGTVDWETPAKEHEGRGYKVPNGALYTTVGDLAKFVVFELGEGPENVLKKETLENNFGQVNTASDDLSSGYGIGFRVSRYGDLVVYGHGGSVAGYRASALFHRESKAGVVVLRNAGGRFNVSELARKSLHLIVQSKMSR